MDGKVALVAEDHELLISMGFVSGGDIYISSNNSIEGRTPKADNNLNIVSYHLS